MILMIILIKLKEHDVVFFLDISYPLKQNITYDFILLSDLFKCLLFKIPYRLCKSAYNDKMQL